MKFVQHVCGLFLLLTTVALAACSSATIPTVSTAAAPTTAPSATSVAAEPAATAVPTGLPAPTTAPTASNPVTFTDPFAYCAAVVNMDQPDASFVGPKMPDVVANGLKKASGASADAPIELFKQGGFWRCMDGKVYACTVGANLPCDSKANTDKTPSSAETDYCKANLNQDIPAYVTGHDTIYTWHCSQQTPTVQQQVFTVDARGYIKEIWYQISPQ
ncbi:MAG: hypothetical protein P4L50_18910 [Anaerolineaceae bacterium]|nr:hypothetical protein [Anaerolineaceae bacterium]